MTTRIGPMGGGSATEKGQLLAASVADLVTEAGWRANPSCSRMERINSAGIILSAKEMSGEERAQYRATGKYRPWNGYQPTKPMLKAVEREAGEPTPVNGNVLSMNGQKAQQKSPENLTADNGAEIEAKGPGPEASANGTVKTKGDHDTAQRGPAAENDAEIDPIRPFAEGKLVITKEIDMASTPAESGELKREMDPYTADAVSDYGAPPKAKGAAQIEMVPESNPCDECGEETEMDCETGRLAYACRNAECVLYEPVAAPDVEIPVTRKASGDPVVAERRAKVKELYESGLRRPADIARKLGFCRVPISSGSFALNIKAAGDVVRQDIARLKKSGQLSAESAQERSGALDGSEPAVELDRQPEAARSATARPATEKPDRAIDCARRAVQAAEECDVHELHADVRSLRRAGDLLDNDEAAKLADVLAAFGEFKVRLAELEAANGK